MSIFGRIKAKIVADEPSDFGSGYATCIRQFLQWFCEGDITE